VKSAYQWKVDGGGAGVTGDNDQADAPHVIGARARKEKRHLPLVKKIEKGLRSEGLYGQGGSRER